jgi:hypothetical protein
MANLQANLRSQSSMALDRPQLFLRPVNQLFFENTTDSAYATLFFAEYDDNARALRYADTTLERLNSMSTVQVSLRVEGRVPRKVFKPSR